VTFVMDYNMPGLDGVQATRELLRISPGVRVVGFSGAQEPEVCERFLSAGATECFTKDQQAQLRDFASQLA
jgi:DNA-binding NarL/FixJ family response regulator